MLDEERKNEEWEFRFQRTIGSLTNQNAWTTVGRIVGAIDVYHIITQHDVSGDIV